MKIRYKDLSFPLKLAVFGGFLTLLEFVVAFMLGFFEGYFG